MAVLPSPSVPGVPKFTGCRGFLTLVKVKRRSSEYDENMEEGGRRRRKEWGLEDGYRTRELKSERAWPTFLHIPPSKP